MYHPPPVLTSTKGWRLPSSEGPRHVMWHVQCRVGVTLLQEAGRTGMLDAGAVEDMPNRYSNLKYLLLETNQLIRHLP